MSYPRKLFILSDVPNPPMYETLRLYPEFRSEYTQIVCEDRALHEDYLRKFCKINPFYLRSLSQTQALIQSDFVIVFMYGTTLLPVIDSALKKGIPMLVIKINAIESAKVRSEFLDRCEKQFMRSFVNIN